MSKPKPNGPTPPQVIALQKENVVKGLKTAAKVVTPMVAATVAAFRRPAEQRLESKGVRQENRGARKEERANRIEEKRPNKAASLREKGAELQSKGSANRKAAETIYKSKKK